MYKKSFPDARDRPVNRVSGLRERAYYNIYMRDNGHYNTHVKTARGAFLVVVTNYCYLVVVGLPPAVRARIHNIVMGIYYTYTYTYIYIYVIRYVVIVGYITRHYVLYIALALFRTGRVQGNTLIAIGRRNMITILRVGQCNTMQRNIISCKVHYKRMITI